MAQDLYAAARAHTQTLPPEQTPEAALARYKAAHPEDPNATVALPGDPAYEGQATLDPVAQAYVKDRPLTDSRLKAQAEAERRLLTNGDNAARENSLMQGVLLNGADEIGGRAAQAGQIITNLSRQLQGLPIEINSSDLNDAYVDTFRRQQGEFAQAHPVQSIGLNVAGGALTGGASLGAGIPAAIGTGAAYGGVSGLNGGTGSFAERLPGAAAGAAVGGVTGGVVQGGAQAAAPYAQRLSGIASGVTRPIREGAARIIGRGQEPGVVAARRITDQFGRSGRSIDEANALAVQYQGAGLSPSVLDVGGENVMASVRASASAEGPGRQLAADYRDRIASELAPRTIERTRGLTPETRDSFTLAGDLTKARQAAARAQYGPAYEETIVVPDVALRALRGPEGTRAMQSARDLASAEQDYQTMEEIDRLLTADLDAAPVASGRALETVRRAMADNAEAYSDSAPQLAQALRSRVNQIDTGLDEIPGLREARGNYRQASEMIDAVGGSPVRGRQVLGRPDRAPQSALTETAPRYAGYLNSLSPEAQGLNQVYQRDQLINRLASAREGAVGPLNTITPGANLPLNQNSPYVARNLEMTFPGQGQQYQQDIGLARQQMTLANRINPNDGSQTAARLGDQASEVFQTGAAMATGGKSVVIGLALRNLVNRVGLNEAERSAIVQLGLGPAEDLQRIIQIAEASRSAGRRPPREVIGYVTRARNVLGSQSPVTQQLEQLLLPSSVAAEDQGQ